LESVCTKPNFNDACIEGSKTLHIGRQLNGKNRVAFRGTSEQYFVGGGWPASVNSCWKMHSHGASSDFQNGKIPELSGVQLKATNLFVRIDTVCQSYQGRLSVLTGVGRHTTAAGPPAIASASAATG
jgi:hypothetical protein